MRAGGVGEDDVVKGDRARDGESHSSLRFLSFAFEVHQSGEIDTSSDRLGHLRDCVIASVVSIVAREEGRTISHDLGRKGYGEHDEGEDFDHLDERVSTVDDEDSTDVEHESCCGTKSDIVSSEG